MVFEQLRGFVDFVMFLVSLTSGVIVFFPAFFGRGLYRFYKHLCVGVENKCFV
jgi:hypothetical protein